jgi:phospholipid/cholesterol/gamma-HCH transport system substrate-binding protein
MVTVSAPFEDVGDLFPSAPVMMADVQVGKVSEIELEDERALVTMEIDESARVPQGVVARVRRTSLLGERIIDLEVPAEVPIDAPLLEDGDRIEITEVRPDLEDLVDQGNDVLAPIAASEVATLVDEGAKGFGGRGEQLGAMLQNFEAIIRAYAGRTEQIRSVIESMNRFNAVLASQANAHAQAVQNTARGLRMLREETDRLEAAIVALNRVSIGGRGILEAHSDEFGRFFNQMRIILEVLRSEEGSIRGLLKWAPAHNRNLQTTEFTHFVQVYQDFIVCGLNDDPSDPARRCPESEH